MGWSVSASLQREPEPLRDHHRRDTIRQVRSLNEWYGPLSQTVTSADLAAAQGNAMYGPSPTVRFVDDTEPITPAASVPPSNLGGNRTGRRRCPLWLAGVATMCAVLLMRLL